MDDAVGSDIQFCFYWMKSEAAADSGHFNHIWDILHSLSLAVIIETYFRPSGHSLVVAF